jgi:hypothetical protein
MFRTCEAIASVKDVKSTWAIVCRLATITAWWIWWILVGLF